MATNNLPQLKTTLNAPSVKAKFEEMLGKRAPQFMTSITSVVGNNALLQKADVNSIIMGAATAASMDLPLNPNLGYAALVPFNSKDGCFAQLQIQVKGWIELFLRSGQCQNIICETVYEGQLVKKNKFTGEYVFDEDAKKSDKIEGFMAYFCLTNGFEKYEYMTIEEVKAHAQKFSQTYRKNIGPWKDMFEQMAQKTVLKSGLKRLDYRMEWEAMFRRYLLDLDAKKPVILCGDLNVAHQEIDIKNPASNRRSAGFTDEERNAMTQLLEAGFADSFRLLHPDEVKYSWWSYRFRARERNAGWRIDYFLVSRRIADKVQAAEIHNEIMGSDHCPVELVIDL